MSKDAIFDAVLCILMIVLAIIYCFYVLIDERKKIVYYKKTLSYETDWDKYSTILRKQRLVILYKKVQLLLLKILVLLKRCFAWK